MHVSSSSRRSALALLSIACALVSFAAPSARAETRALAFPTAYRPYSLNNVAVSATAPVAFAGSRDTDTLFAFDPRSGAELGRIEVGDGPTFVTVQERDGQRLLAVTCNGFFGAARSFTAFVDATDPAQMRVTGTASLPAGYIFFLGHQTLRFAPGGSTVLVTGSDENNGRGLLLSYDIATGAELGRVDIGFAPGSLDLSTESGRAVAVITQSVAPHGKLSIVDVTDPASLHMLMIVTLPKKSGLYNVNNVALSADGRYGFVGSGDGDALYAFEVATGRVLSRTVSGSFPTYTRVYARDGAPRVLLVAENGAALFVYDVADPAHPLLVSHFEAPVTFLDVPPVISADGRTAFAPTTDGNYVYAVDLDTGNERYQTTAGDYPVATAIWRGGGEEYVCVASTHSSDVTLLRPSPAGFYFAGHFTGPSDGVKFTLYQNIVLSGDGRTAFVASKSTNELLAIDVATATLAGRVKVSKAPSQIALAEDATTGRRRIAVFCAGDSALDVVDATDPAHMAAVGSAALESPYPFYLEYANVVLTSDGATAFVADGFQFVYAVDLATARVVGSVGTGFVPITIAEHEANGRRLLAVLNAMSDSTSVAVLDATNPAAMSIVSSARLPKDLVVALNNVPRFSADGRFVIIGASISETLFTIDAATGTIAGTVERTSAVIPAPFADAGKQYFAAVNLGSDPAQLYRLKRSGAPRAAIPLNLLDGGFFLVGNDPTVSADGAAGLVPDYGRASLLAFDPRAGVVTGELPLGEGPGEVAIDRATGAVAAIEVNGTASRILIGNLADLRAPARPASLAATRAPARATPAARGLLTTVDAGPRGARTSGAVTFSLPQGHLKGRA